MKFTYYSKKVANWNQTDCANKVIEYLLEEKIPFIK